MSFARVRSSQGSVGEDYKLNFQKIDVLLPNGDGFLIGYEIEHEQVRTWMGKRKLWEFLHNNPAELKVAEFDVVI